MCRSISIHFLRLMQYTRWYDSQHLCLEYICNKADFYIRELWRYISLPCAFCCSFLGITDNDISTVWSNKNFWRTLRVLCNALLKLVQLPAHFLYPSQGVLRDYGFLFLGDKRKLNIFIHEFKITLFWFIVLGQLSNAYFLCRTLKFETAHCT